MPTNPAESREGLKRKAEQARRLASNLQGDEAAERLLEYAKELERQAASISESQKHG